MSDSNKKPNLSTDAIYAFLLEGSEMLKDKNLTGKDLDDVVKNVKARCMIATAATDLAKVQVEYSKATGEKSAFLEPAPQEEEDAKLPAGIVGRRIHRIAG